MLLPVKSDTPGSPSKPWARIKPNMSIRVMSLVWKTAENWTPIQLLTLLALGDWADDDGLCWPKMEKLASRSRQSVRNARYTITRLTQDGFLEVLEGGGRGKANMFQLNLQRLQVLDTEQKIPGKPEQETRQVETINPANGDIAIRKIRQEPSKNLSRVGRAMKFVQEIHLRYTGEKCPWNASETRILKETLNLFPDEKFETAVRNYYRKYGKIARRPRVWLSDLGPWVNAAQGPNGRSFEVPEPPRQLSPLEILRQQDQEHRRRFPEQYTEGQE